MSDLRFVDEHGMWIGTATHRAIELYVKDRLNEETLDAELVPRLNAWKKFQAATGFQVVDSEHPVYSETLGVAGTLDLVGLFPDGTEGIVEIKSGNIMPWTAIQTAAQDLLLGGKRRKRFGLKVPKTGSPSVKPFTDENDYNVFIAAVTVALWKIRVQKTWGGT